MNTATRHNTLDSTHSALFVAVGISTLAAATFMGAGTPAVHLALLVILLPLAGIPHGALDYYLARKTFRRWRGRWWAVWFVAIYLFIMSGVVAVWMISPVWSLGAFLLLTIYHFGTGDAIRTRRTPPALRVTEVMARGGMVITFPALAARSDVVELFSYLVGEPGAVLLAGGLASLAPVASACVLVTVGWSTVEFARFRLTASLGRVMELLVTALIFMQLPPLLAFTLYFSVMHSPRHMLAVANRKPEGTLFTRLLNAFFIALPVTVVTMVIGAVAYFLLGGLSFNMAQLMKIVFIGIASMTYPHVVLVDVAKRLGVINAGTGSEHAGVATRLASAPKGARE